MTRTRSSSTASLAATLLLAAAACRGGDDTGDDTPTPDAMSDDVSIYDVQGSLPIGTQVNLRGVVVTAIDTYGERTGNFWVQEPDGGPFSGVLVFGAPLTAVADLQVGDVVDLEDVVKTEFALADDTSGRTTTELEPPEGGEITVTVISSGAPPEPAVVDALAIGLLPTAQERDDALEQWEGVLIRVENVSVLEELDQIGGTPQDPPFEELRVTGPLSVDTSLAAIEPVTRDTCLASITGIGDYFFNYKLLPRATGDVVAGGSGCPAQEADATTCDDGLDNEADGFADCADFSCRDVAVCVQDTTISMIQMGMVADGATVALNDVVVTAVDDLGGTAGDLKGFWAADSLAAAPYNGVYVFLEVTTLPAGIVVGATVDIQGAVDEFDLPNPFPDGPISGDTLTEIDARAGTGAVTVVAPPGGSLPTPLTGVGASTLSAIDTGEPYEGVLVQFGPAKVTATPGFDQLTLNTATGTITVDDEAFNYASSSYTSGTCFTSVVGVMSLNIFQDTRFVAPRTADDLAVGTAADCTGL
jgi:hypothetical protein